MTCVSEEHSSNELLPILTTEEGIVMLANDVHLLNKPSSIDTTEEGIEIFLSDEHA